MNDTDIKLTAAKLMKHSGNVRQVSTGFDTTVGAANQIGLNHKTILTSYGVLMTPFVAGGLLESHRKIIEGMKNAKAMTENFAGKIKGFSDAVDRTDADNADEINKVARRMFGVRPGQEGMF